jgi:hypothetical protein
MRDSVGKLLQLIDGNSAHARGGEKPTGREAQMASDEGHSADAPQRLVKPTLSRGSSSTSAEALRSASSMSFKDF